MQRTLDGECILDGKSELPLSEQLSGHSWDTQSRESPSSMVLVHNLEKINRAGIADDVLQVL